MVEMFKIIKILPVQYMDINPTFEYLYSMISILFLHVFLDGTVLNTTGHGMDPRVLNWKYDEIWNIK